MGNTKTHFPFGFVRGDCKRAMSPTLQNVLYLVLAFFLVFLNGFFVAAEFAIVKVRSTRIDELAQKGTFGAKKAREAVHHLDAYLSATQLGITLASLGLGYIGEPAFAHLIQPVLGYFSLSPATQKIVAVAVGFTVITALHIVLGELAPKSLAIQKAEQVTLAIIYPLDIFYKIFRWPIAALNAVAALVLKPFGLSNVGEHVGSEAHSEDELRMILSASHQGGEIKESELTLVNHVLDFAGRRASEVMVPRPDVVFLSTEKTVTENIERADKAGYTRYPLMEGAFPDQIIGMVHIKDLLALTRQPPTDESDADKLRRIARRMPQVPETKPIDTLLREFQRKRQQMAVIVDEFGGTAGIVTLEDVIEEIVGDIEDEFERNAPEMEPAGRDCWNVDARMALSKMERALNVEVPEEEREVDSVGGWILAHQTGQTPRVGDRVSYGEATMTVLEVSGRRVRKVRVCVPEREASSEQGTGNRE